MESDWRFGVWNLGWGQSDVKLAARLLTPFPLTSHIALRDVAGVRWIARGLVSSQGYVPIWNLVAPALGLSFPFGFNVHPD